jgi:hypothetical protein
MPDDLHAKLVARARLERITISEYVIRVLRRDLVLPATAQWVDGLNARIPLSAHPKDIDVIGALDEIRGEWSAEPQRGLPKTPCSYPE